MLNYIKYLFKIVFSPKPIYLKRTGLNKFITTEQLEKRRLSNLNHKFN